MGEAARTPARFRTRVLDQFRSFENIATLRAFFVRHVPAGPLRDFARTTLDAAVYSFAADRGPELLGSDPAARRGDPYRTVSLSGEVRRLNRAFCDDRLALLQDQAATLTFVSGMGAPDAANEPYHMQMFIADSLRPPGLEHLNPPGPLYALHPDRDGPEADSLDQDPDDPEAGDPDRARAEVGPAFVWADVTAADREPGGGRGGGIRFMRRTAIPFWQLGGRSGYEPQFEGGDTLGARAREFGGHVRRWDMARVDADQRRRWRDREERRAAPC